MRKNAPSVANRAISKRIAGRSSGFYGNIMSPKPRVRVAMEPHKPKPVIEVIPMAVEGATAVVTAVAIADAVTGAEGEELPLELLII